MLVYLFLFILETPKLLTGTLANCEDPDEMPHNVAFHQGLHCLLRQNQSSETEIQKFLEIITYDPSIYTIDHPDFILYVYLENINLILAFIIYIISHPIELLNISSAFIV